jgi:TRAP transporter TAXI family solute receptor
MAKEKGISLTRRRRLGGLLSQARIVAPALVAIVVGFLFAYQFVEPAPPHRVVIASGPEAGAYHAFAKRYAAAMAREGIELLVRPTVGSEENLRLLADPASGVAIAFMQGGIGAPAEHPDLTSLGSLYYEPLWVFVRGATPVRRLPELRGKRVAIGVAGSGTRPVAQRLLADNGITAESATLLDVGGADAVEALRAGRIDAAFFITAPSSSAVRTLMGTPGVRLVHFGRAEAYARLYRYLSPVILPEGAIDLARNVPSREVRLLAPAATLVVGPGLHPALAGLLLQIIHGVHREGGLLERTGEFPSPGLVTFPLADEARRFYDNGPPFLQRYLPFWAANLVDRLKIMLLPLITLLYPLFKLLPPTYRWRMGARINRGYKALQALDDRMHAGDVSAADGLAELARIEAEVAHLSVPAGFADRVYNLRMHIDLLRRRLREG